VRLAKLLPLILAACAAGADIDHITVWRDDTMYYITPWLSRLDNGDLMVTAREAHRRRKDQIGHVDPTARGVAIRSRDGGRTWSEKTILDDETYRFSQTEDVPWTQLSGGSLFLNLYAWRVSPLPLGAQPDGNRHYVYTFEGLYGIRSNDRGKTWTMRTPITVASLPKLAARVPVTQMPDGELVLPVYGFTRMNLPTSAWLIRSRDRGATWGEHALIATDPDGKVRFDEPFLLRKRDGGMIAMIRTGGYLYQSNSSDNGRTWSKAGPTKIWGYPAHLLELPDGRILCTYGYRRAPFGLRYCLSRDGGRTWDVDREVVLRADGGSGDLGYPSVVELGDGRVLMVYWMNQEKEGVADSDVRYIAGTFFRP
jgi:hypothetical protein